MKTIQVECSCGFDREECIGCYVEAGYSWCVPCYGWVEGTPCDYPEDCWDDKL